MSSRMYSLATSILLASIVAVAACRTPPLGGGGSAGSAGGGGSLDLSLVSGSLDLAAGDGGRAGFPDLSHWPLPDGFPNDGSSPGRSDLGPSPPAPIPCGRNGVDPGSADPFKRAQYGVAANWRGYATSPWIAPWTVEIDFSSSETYLARTLDWSTAGYHVPPFYYDADPESGKYHLSNLQSDGTIVGQLYLAFTSTPSDISELTLNSDLTHLHFQFFHFGAGPIVYELDCYQ